MDTEDLTAIVREARAERDQADRERDVAVRGLHDAHATLLEIKRLALMYSADTREQIVSEADGAIRAIDPLGMRAEVKRQLDRQVEGMLAGAGPSMADACTIRDTTTDQSKVRNHPDDITQAEREAFFEMPPPARYDAAVRECGPECWIVFEYTGSGWYETARVEATSAASAIEMVIAGGGLWLNSDRTMSALPLSAIEPGFTVTTETTTDTRVTVTQKELSDVPQ